MATFTMVLLVVAGMLYTNEYSPTTERGLMIGAASLQPDLVGQTSNIISTSQGQKWRKDGNAVNFMPAYSFYLKYHFGANNDSIFFFMPQVQGILMDERWNVTVAGGNPEPYTVVIHHTPSVRFSFGADFNIFAPYFFGGWSSISYEDASVAKSKMIGYYTTSFGAGVNIYTFNHFVMSLEYAKTFSTLSGFTSIPTNIDYKSSAVSFKLGYYIGGDVNKQRRKQQNQLIKETTKSYEKELREENDKAKQEQENNIGK